MKRFVFAQLLAAALLLASNVQAQSLKDLLNKKNIGNVVSTIAGDKTPEMEGFEPAPVRDTEIYPPPA